MLFSWIVELLKPRRIAMEITAAGIDVEKVRPTFSPAKTFAAVKRTVITAPITRPRMVSSERGGASAGAWFNTAMELKKTLCDRELVPDIARIG